MAEKAAKVAKAKRKPKKARRKVSEPIPVSTVKAEEYWSTYQLSDGTKMRIRPIVIEVVRLPNKFDDKGNPAYTITSGMIHSLESPRKLKKKK